MTRYEGKNPFPRKRAFARIGAELVRPWRFHLGITRIHKIVEELIPHYGEDCPVAVCYRTSWPDQDYVCGNVSGYCCQSKREKISLVLV